MSKFLAFYVAVVLYITISTTARHIGEEDEDAFLKYVQCRSFDNSPVIGLLPHPTNCYKFYSCRLISDTETAPLEMDCASGDNGPLFYDFRDCACHYNNTVCFDGIEHREEFYACAEIYDPSSQNNSILTLDRQS